MPYKDKVDRKIYAINWAIENKDKIQVANKRWKGEQRRKLAEYKAARGCARCPEREPACIELHHPDRSTKDMDPGNWIAAGWSFERIRIEAEKLILLCANCHRKEHHGRIETSMRVSSVR